MIILGISTSSRHWGNTDLLVQQALAGARDAGAETAFLHCADVDLRPCTGCMRCVFSDRDCVLDDGLPAVLARLREADAVVLGSPAYVLGASGRVKLLQERLIRYATVKREFSGKPGIALVAAGRQGYEPFALPQVTLTLLSLGIQIVDQFVGYGQGPGEVLDDEGAMARAETGGAALARGETLFRGESGVCPSCHFDLTTLAADGSARCSLCDLEGRWVIDTASGGAEAACLPRFEAVPGAQPRWTENRVRSHFEDSLLPSRDRFREQRHEIRRRVEAARAAMGEGEYATEETHEPL